MCGATLVGGRPVDQWCELDEIDIQGPFAGHHNVFQRKYDSRTGTLTFVRSGWAQGSLDSGSTAKR